MSVLRNKVLGLSLNLKNSIRERKIKFEKETLIKISIPSTVLVMSLKVYGKGSERGKREREGMGEGGGVR